MNGNPGDCTCAYHPSGTNHVKGAGPTRPQIIILGEAPGRDEDATGLPFVGGAGRVLDSLLAQAGIRRAECYITNVLKHRPPNNSLDGVDYTKEFPALAEELSKIECKYIISLGATPLTFFGRHGIGDWRGSMFRYNVLGREFWVLATIHPAFLMRQQEMWSTVVHDLLKMGRVAYVTGVIEHEKRYITHPSPSMVKEYLNSIPPHSEVCLDVETLKTGSGLDIVGISKAPHEGMSIQADEDQVINILTFLNRRDIKYVMQNGLFDMGVMEDVFNIAPKCEYDTMLMHHLICNELPHDLGYLASVYSDLACYWQNTDYGAIYNCKDLDATLQVREGEQKDLDRYGLGRMADIVMRAQAAVYAMTRRGVCFHIPTCRDAINSLTHRGGELLAMMSHVAENKYFNPDSPRDIAEVLYNKLKLPKLYKRGTAKVTTGKKELEKKYGNVDFVKWTIEYRHVMKMARTYVPDENLLDIIDENHGIYHPDWKMHGTATGRYACDIHTYPTEMRKVIVPRPGYTLLGRDLSQIEFRIDMWASKDPVGMELINRKGDIHRMVAAVAYGKKAEDITPYERFQAKFVAHGCRYGRGAESVAEQFKISLQQAQALVDMVLKPYQVYLDWRKNNAEFAYVNRYLVNPFGRRIYYYSGNKDEIERQAYSGFAQSAAHDLTMIKHGNLFERLKNEDIHFTIDHHDALYAEVPIGSEEHYDKIMEEEFEKEVLPGLYTPSGSKTGTNWGELDDRK